jgi:hypothetical protein
LNATKSFPSIVLTGPRQSGKTTLLKNILGGYTYTTFDDPLSRERALSDPNLFLDTLGEKIIIDEIQYVPNLLSYVKMRIDQKRDVPGRFIFTGSQQFPLMKNIGDSLAGRIAVFELLPFSITEQSNLKKGHSTKEHFKEACLRGCFPEPFSNPYIDRDIWYGSYFQTYLERDVRGLYNIGNLRGFQQFIQLLAARCSEVLNLSDFSKDLGISISTLKTWISVLESSRIIYLLMPYYNNLGKRITKSPKLYFLDTGFICYLSGIKTFEQILLGPLSGKLFENFIIQESVKHFIHKGKRPPLYYFRTNNQLEVDLVIEKTIQKILPVEIKLTETPRIADSAYILRFKNLYPNLSIETGAVVSLTDQTIPLNRESDTVTLSDYLIRLSQD